MQHSEQPPIEFTVFNKTGGPLTKRISLSQDGKPVSNGSACVMSRGQATRMRCGSLGELAAHIERLQTNQAIGLGALRDDLPDQAEIVTAAELGRLNGAAAPHVVARTAGSIIYRPERPALALLDYDRKGMSADVAARIEAVGGFWGAVVSACPAIAAAGRVERTSTSAALFRTDTFEPLPGSGGLHTYVLVKDGSDVQRFLETLHERMWLAGFGWVMLGAAGQFLDRSIVDRMVGAAERLVFEAPPILEPPIAQDSEARRPVAHEGDALNTAIACPPLTIVERERLDKLRNLAKHALRPAAAAARKAFVEHQAERVAKRTGLAPDAAKRVAERWCGGVLLPHVELPFDDPDLAGTTVGDILADPERFEGATLADPLEGIDYGRCKARVMLREDGEAWIHSFAHGRTVYELKYDAASVRAAIEAAPKERAAATFTKLVPMSDADSGETEALRDLAHELGGVGKAALNRDLKTERQRLDQRRAEESRERRETERRDPRVRLTVPMGDAELGPVMELLNDVLGDSRDPEPPMRDVEGHMAAVRVRGIPATHALTSCGANGEETEESRLPPPEQPLLTRLDLGRLTELIERHIDFYDPASLPKHRSVRLPATFVRNYMNRDDGRLPAVRGVATLPLVLRDGTLLSGRGLNPGHHLVSRVPPELLAALPRPEDCDKTAVAEAMQFLTDEWLCDVATDYAGKAVLIALALTLIERTLVSDRPAFFVTAGRRGGGKTTVLNMLMMAITGVRPSASPWSGEVEERRKALLSYLMEGPPAIVWDNIPRGTAISCQYIEASCTSYEYSDRVLGESRIVKVPAGSIHTFTGNNIGPKGDMSSRSLRVWIDVDRADPENRPFRHPHPIDWTEANRRRILRELYTILLGNPRLRPGNHKPAESRFKDWWELVGSAVEHAARRHADHVGAMTIDHPPVWEPNPVCPPEAISFRNMFLTGEQDDEDSAAMVDLLEAMLAKYGTNNFTAADLAQVINNQDASGYRSNVDKQLAEVAREVLCPGAKPYEQITSKRLGRRLRSHKGEPVVSGDRTLILREKPDPSGAKKGAHVYAVEIKSDQPKGA